MDVVELLNNAIDKLFEAEQDLEDALRNADEELRDELKVLLDEIFGVRDRLERLI